MKKTHILFAALFSSLAFISCGFSNLQAPKEVKVRTNATYEFSVMNFDSTKEDSKFKVSDYFDLGKILEEKTSETSEDNGMNIYKYNDGSQFQQFLIHMPLKEIEFDFSESFKDMDFSKSMENFNFDKEIEVPDVKNLHETKPVSLGDIKEKLGTIVVGSGTTSSESTVNFAGDSEKSFGTVTYKTGSLVVIGDPTVPVVFLTGSVELISGGVSFGTQSFDNDDHAAVFSLAGKTLDSANTKLKFSDIANGQQYIVAPTDDSVLQSATGLTLKNSFAPTVTVDDVVFHIQMNEDIKSCTITDGTLTVDIADPPGWSSGIINYTVDLTGGLTKSVSNTNKTANLGSPATALSSSDITAKTNVTLNLDNKDINFDNEPKVDVSVVINKVSATVTMPANYPTTITKNEAVTTDITDYVNRIYWDKSGFDVYATNDLPEHNDITLAFDSDFLNMDSNIAETESKKTIIAQGAAAQEKKYEFRGKETSTSFYDSGETDYFSSMDLNGVITLPGYDPVENTITVENVSPNTIYHLNLRIEPVLNWEKAEVKMPANSNFAQNMDTGINKKTLFSTLGEQFADKIKISSMPLYMYTAIPDKLADGMNFSGTIMAFYGKDNGNTKYTTPLYILGSESGPAPVPTSGVLPDLTKNSDNDVTTDLGNPSLYFEDAMNIVSEEGTLYLDYNIGLAGTAKGDIEITPKDIENYKAAGKSSIKIDIVLLLTMDFKLDDVISIDMMDIAKKKDSDLLGRSEPTDTSSYEKYLSVVKSASLIIDNFMLPMSGDVALKVDMYKDGSGETKEVGNGKSFSLEVNPSKLLASENFPLTPDIQFVIGRAGETTNFGVLRTMPISGKIKLKVKAKGDIPVYPFSEQD